MLPLCLAALLVPVPQALPQAPPSSSPPVDTCRKCHALLEDRLGEPARQFQDDIHATRGFSCSDCHGGNPREEDPEKSMDRRQGYLGVPKRTRIPRLCARCHSDGAFMRAYNPSLRTDQLAQYGTSVHGRRLGRGDTRVAVCSDCHGVHNIRPASRSTSKVHPMQIPATCARCHSDAVYLKPYNIRTDQLAGYLGSVHYRALAGGELSAPTCASCHGNHGAAPPGVASVERVCGTCHAFQEQLFDQSPHKAPWEAGNRAACLTCHGNHLIEPTGDAMLGTGKEARCANCHVPDDGGWKVAQQMFTDLTGLDSAVRRAAALLDRAEHAGMEVGEARLTLAGAREQLIKARVDIQAAV